MRIGFIVLVLSIFSTALPMSAWAGPRDDTVAVLEALESKAESETVRVLVNDGTGNALRIGDEITYRFESDQDGYLTAIHVDTHGAATLLYPRAGNTASQLGRGQAVSFPAMDDGFTLEVKPPTGRDVVYAYLTEAPISRRDLGLDEREVVIAFEPPQAPAFVKKLGGLLEARSGGKLRANKISQQIDGRGDVQYRSLDIVDFFGTRTRSISPPKLDLQIQFASDSAELDEAARRDIDEFAAALSDPRLASLRFAVAGHTDDRGTDDHNISLSRRRADSVRRYLVESGGVEGARLRVEAYGERAPLVKEDSPFARKMNRRVEFMMIRE